MRFRTHFANEYITTSQHTSSPLGHTQTINNRSVASVLHLIRPLGVINKSIGDRIANRMIMDNSYYRLSHRKIITNCEDDDQCRRQTTLRDSPSSHRNCTTFFVVIRRRFLSIDTFVWQATRENSILAKSVTDLQNNIGIP